MADELCLSNIWRAKHKQFLINIQNVWPENKVKKKQQQQKCLNITFVQFITRMWIISVDNRIFMQIYCGFFSPAVNPNIRHLIKWHKEINERISTVVPLMGF